MSTPTELWKNWEGKMVDEKLPLKRWLGGSDHSAVFLTERNGGKSRQAAIKLLPAQNLDEEVQLSRWAGAAKLSHPHLIRLFECGRCQVDDTRLLYVVMEYAEENLAEMIPLRPLDAAEVSEMLPPVAETLAHLHQAGYAHGHIKPANIMAVDNQLKISADELGKTGDVTRAPNPYDAPEISTRGLSPEADIWSLGSTLVAVMTQNEPNLNNGGQGQAVVPETIPQPLREIARQCLQLDPQQRCTLSDILRQIQPQAPAAAGLVEAHTPQARPKRWMVLPIVVAALFLIAWVGNKFLVRRTPAPATEARPVSPPPSPDIPAPQSPALFSEKGKPAQSGRVRGSVLHEVMPVVSRSAQNTITGRVKVSVQVAVDASGNVSQLKFVSPGPSKYFANRALAAARDWKFNAPQVDGQAAASEWVLRFQFGRTSTQVFPAETNP